MSAGYPLLGICAHTREWASCGSQPAQKGLPASGWEAHVEIYCLACPLRLLHEVWALDLLNPSSVCPQGGPLLRHPNFLYNFVFWINCSLLCFLLSCLSPLHSLLRAKPLSLHNLTCVCFYCLWIWLISYPKPALSRNVLPVFLWWLFGL